MDESLYAGLAKEFDRVKPHEGYVTNGERGILYVGGGKYWAGIVTGIRLLRRYGCDLPVEVWYRGDVEYVEPEDIKQLGNVSLHNIDYYSRQLRDNKIRTRKAEFGGWEAKTYAMTHTGLSQVLYLDADAYCVDDPTDAFDLLIAKPFAFWQDLPNHAADVKWDKIYPKGAGFDCLIQGGQLFIDRDKAWKLIHIAHYLCQNSKYYFQYMYGDQDAWRVGLAILEHETKQKLYYRIGNAEWNHVAFVCRYNGGEPLIVHRCRSKLFEPLYIPERKVNYSNPQYYLPKELDVFREFTAVVQSREVPASKVFGGIYDRKLWGRGSGAGSSEREAGEYIRLVNEMIASEQWNSIVDAGCGDGYVASQLKVRSYIGYDCCPVVIRQTAKRYMNLRFLPLDIYQNYAIMQVGDCLLCKDVLHHWPNEWVVSWLKGLIESRKWKTLLVCVDREQLEERQDTYLGGYRALDYRMSPLNQYPFKSVAKWEGKELLRLDVKGN